MAVSIGFDGEQQVSELKKNVGIVRKACKEGRGTTRVPCSIVRVPLTNGEPRHSPRSRGMELPGLLVG